MYIVISKYKDRWLCIKRNNKTLYFSSYKEAQKYVDELNYSNWKMELSIVELR